MASQFRNVWSLFNSFTDALKSNIIELPRRTEALHGLLDTNVGLDAPSLNGSAFGPVRLRERQAGGRKDPSPAGGLFFSYWTTEI